MALAWSTTCGHRGLTGSGGEEPPAKGKAESRGLASLHVRLSGCQGVWGQRPCGAEPRSLESLTPWRASLLGVPGLGHHTVPPSSSKSAQSPVHAHPSPHPVQWEEGTGRGVQLPGGWVHPVPWVSEAVLPCLSGSRGSGVCPSTSRNGSWWEKSQHGLSATGGGWEEGEEGYECLTQIKQPQKNKGRKQLEAMASIFFQVNFPPPSPSLHLGEEKLELAEGNGCTERLFRASATCPRSL